MITKIKIVNIIKAKYVLAFHNRHKIIADQFTISATKIICEETKVDEVDLYLVNILYLRLRLQKRMSQ